MSATVANSYLINGFSFNNKPTLLLDGNITAKLGDSYITLIGLHTRNIKNHFNGKTSWVGHTGMVDFSQDFGVGTASIGAYYTFLPEDIFELDGVNGIYGSFATNTNPSIKIYADRGFKYINGILGKATLSGSANVGNRPVNASIQLGAMSDYFIKKKGLHYLTIDLSSPIYSEKDFSVDLGVKYQNGFGEDSVSGLEGKVSVNHTF